jgi:hypothetical protein
MSCCFCCVSEDEQIGRVLSKFEGVFLPCNARPGFVQKIVGRCAMSSTTGGLIAPISGRQCVYYEVEVQEKIERTDEEGNTHVSWRRLVHEEERGVDFFLADDAGAAVYVNSSSVATKIYSVDDNSQISGDMGGGGFWSSDKPASPALVALMASSRVGAQPFRESHWKKPIVREPH